MITLTQHPSSNLLARCTLLSNYFTFFTSSYSFSYIFFFSSSIVRHLSVPYSMKNPTFMNDPKTTFYDSWFRWRRLKNITASLVLSRVHNPPECATPDPALHWVLVDRNWIFWCHACTPYQRKAGLEARHHFNPRVPVTPRIPLRCLVYGIMTPRSDSARPRPYAELDQALHTLGVMYS